MNRIARGQFVDIAIRGVRLVGTHALTGAPTIVDEHGDEFRMPPQAAMTLAVPKFAHNALYADRSGHVWLAQVNANDDLDDDGIELHSSLGVCTPEHATEWYGPFRLVAGPWAPASNEEPAF